MIPHVCVFSRRCLRHLPSRKSFITILTFLKGNALHLCLLLKFVNVDENQLTVYLYLMFSIKGKILIRMPALETFLARS